MQTPSKPSSITASWAIPVTAAAVASAIPLQTPYITGENMTTKAASSPQQSAPTRGHHEIDERYLNAKLEAVEARTETNFAKLLGKIDAIATSVVGLQTDIGGLKTEINTVENSVSSAKGLIVTTVIGSAIAIAGLAWAGVALFQGGMGTASDAFAAGASASAGATNSDEPS